MSGSDVLATPAPAPAKVADAPKTAEAPPPVEAPKAEAPKYIERPTAVETKTDTPKADAPKADAPKVEQTAESAKPAKTARAEKPRHKRYWTEGRIIGELHRHGVYW